MTDCVIIGSGMAGISAALTLKARGLSFILLGSPELSAKISRAESVLNYPAFCLKTGAAFCKVLKSQLAEQGIAVKAGRAVGVYAFGDKVSVQTGDDEWIEAKTAILATGVSFSGSAAEGEAEFLGRGVSYCATCDGFLYKGKTVVVTATSRGFEKDASLLENFAAKLFFVPLYRGCTFAPKKPSTEIFTDGLVRIEGGSRVERAVFRHRTVETDGVFLLKESAPLAALCGGLETDGKHVLTDRAMRTNLKGVFAAGDCTGTPYQYAKAAGEGNVAALSVADFLSGERNENGAIPRENGEDGRIKEKIG